MTASDITEFDPAARRLCPDGACTGLLDDGGRCSECGKQWANVHATAPGGGVFVAAEPQAGDEDPENLLTFPTGAGFDPNRQLCPDGSCTGVVGSDNRCSECGRDPIQAG